jgi:hypothetical protein
LLKITEYPWNDGILEEVLIYSIDAKILPMFIYGQEANAINFLLKLKNLTSKKEENFS